MTEQSPIVGDLVEEYREVVLPARGRVRAALWLVVQLVSLARPWMWGAVLGAVIAQHGSDAHGVGDHRVGSGGLGQTFQELHAVHRNNPRVCSMVMVTNFSSRTVTLMST